MTNKPIGLFSELSVFLENEKKIFFISDFHLGVPDYNSSLKREKYLVQWLNSISSEAQEIFILGDVFDFWFEYKHVVPKGYFLFFSCLEKLVSSGVIVHYFPGNHDLWAGDYLPKHVGVKLHRNPLRLLINGAKFIVGHGDGLGPGDHGYKLLKRVFQNYLCQFLFRWIHPDIGISIANHWSAKSRRAVAKEQYLGDDNEWLVQFCLDFQKKDAVDYFIFGHRHLVIDKQFDSGFRYINLGEWFSAPHAASFDGKDLKLFPV